MPVSVASKLEADLAAIMTSNRWVVGRQYSATAVPFWPDVPLQIVVLRRQWNVGLSTALSIGSSMAVRRICADAVAVANKRPCDADDVEANEGREESRLIAQRQASKQT